MARRLVAGELSLDQFVKLCAPTASPPLEDAHPDLDRKRRCGFPEVVFAEGKSVPSLLKILAALLEAHADVLATRVSEEQASAAMREFAGARHNDLGRVLRIAAQPGNHTDRDQQASAGGRIAIVTAGTSDRPVAEEARETALWMGAEVTMIQDVGVAGPHRLPERLHEIEGADAAVVIAGMEGALPSIVGGYVDCPVIGVPTSVGYGASFGGVAALLGMLNSCAANVTVVNIDAGFKGAYVAGMIARRLAEERRR